MQSATKGTVSGALCLMGVPALGAYAVRPRGRHAPTAAAASSGLPSSRARTHALLAPKPASRALPRR